MKLLSIINARSVWLLPLGDLNPRGKFLETAIEQLINRYSFKIKESDSGTAVNRDQLLLEKGVFTNSENEAIEIALSIHSDGFVADTRSSTSDSDDFLDDLLNWLHSEYGLEDYKKAIQKKIYVNEVYIESNSSLNIINPNIDGFLKKLSSSLVGHKTAPFEITGISCATDPTGSSKPVSFRLERALNTAFEDNRYYSIGPFETEVHLSLLEEFEALLNK